VAGRPRPLAEHDSRRAPEREADLAVDVRDADDASVIAAAVAGRAVAIVTGDRDILDDPVRRGWLANRSVAVLTPAELLDRLPAP
jgi:predicted nucleic acid-binding protein